MAPAARFRPPPKCGGSTSFHWQVERLKAELAALKTAEAEKQRQLAEAAARGDAAETARAEVAAVAAEVVAASSAEVRSAPISLRAPC